MQKTPLEFIFFFLASSMTERRALDDDEKLKYQFKVEIDGGMTSTVAVGTLETKSIGMALNHLNSKHLSRNTYPQKLLKGSEANKTKFSLIENETGQTVIALDVAPYSGLYAAKEVGELFFAVLGLGHFVKSENLVHPLTKIEKEYFGILNPSGKPMHFVGSMPIGEQDPFKLDQSLLSETGKSKHLTFMHTFACTMASPVFQVEYIPSRSKLDLELYKRIANQLNTFLDQMNFKTPCFSARQTEMEELQVFASDITWRNLLNDRDTPADLKFVPRSEHCMALGQFRVSDVTPAIILRGTLSDSLSDPFQHFMLALKSSDAKPNYCIKNNSFACLFIKSVEGLKYYTCDLHTPLRGQSFLTFEITGLNGEPLTRAAEGFYLSFALNLKSAPSVRGGRAFV